MFKVTNTGTMPLNIHGTICRPGRSVAVTERQWLVFEASMAGSRAIAMSAVSAVPMGETVKAKPSKQTKPKAEPVGDVESGDS